MTLAFQYLSTVATLGALLIGFLFVAVTFIFRQWDLTMRRVLRESTSRPVIALGASIITLMFLVGLSVLWMGTMTYEDAVTTASLVSLRVTVTFTLLAVSFGLVVFGAVWMAVVSRR